MWNSVISILVSGIVLKFLEGGGLDAGTTGECKGFLMCVLRMEDAADPMQQIRGPYLQITSAELGKTWT